MPIICIILLSFLAIFAFLGLVFLLCKYCLEFSTEEFIIKTRKTEKTFSDSFKTISSSYSRTLPGFERIQQRKPSSYSDQTKTGKTLLLTYQKTEERKEEKGKPCLKLLKPEKRKEETERRREKTFLGLI